MLKNFNNSHIYYDTKLIDNVENIYTTISNFSCNDFTELCLNIGKFKINSLLLFDAVVEYNSTNRI